MGLRGVGWSALVGLLACGVAGARAEAPPSASAPPAIAAAAPLRRAVGNLVYDGILEVPPAIAERTRQYAAARSASVFSWDSRGNGLLVGTRFGETNQVHHVAGPGQARVQRTFLAEPVASAAAHPARPEGFWYLSDVGGREAWQIFWFEAASGRSRLLTDGKSRNEGLAVSPQGDGLAWVSTRRNGRDFDVWTSDGREASSAKLVLERQGQWNVLGFSPDGTRLLLRSFVSVTRSALHVLDLGSGQVRAVTPDTPGVSVPDAAWLDDSTLLVASDEGAEVAQLARLDLSTGARTVVGRDSRWGVVDLAVSRDGGQVAWVRNEGGGSALLVAGARDLDRPRRVPLPLGVVGPLGFDLAGERLAFSFEQPAVPSDVWTWNLRKGDLTRWTTSEVGGLDPAGFVTPTLAHARSFDGRDIPYWRYAPEAPGKRLPVIVSIHGGPEGQTQASFSPNLQYWAR